MHYSWQMAISVGYILTSRVPSKKSKFNSSSSVTHLPCNLKAERKEKVAETHKHFQINSEVEERERSPDQFIPSLGSSELLVYDTIL